MPSKTHTLDVRGDFRSGENPFGKIQSALGRVARGETLRLLVPFEPLPLYELARGKGLTHEARQTADGDWEVLFSHQHGGESSTGKAVAKTRADGRVGGAKPTEIVDVDARGLEPPQPMVMILEALEALSDDATLSAQTDRRPVHLYPMLEARGFTGTSEEQPDGSFITYIVQR